MRYGSIPVVRAVGGLRDTVREGGDDMNGFVFWHNCIWQFGEALERAFKAWRDPATQVHRAGPLGLSSLADV
eukprot:tig00020746_g13661.t1